MIKLVKHIVFLLFRLGLIPSGQFKERVGRSYRELQIEEKRSGLFRGRHREWSEDGYWYVSPMPSAEELDEYYERSYWQGRSDWASLVNSRDVGHFVMLEEHLRRLAAGTPVGHFINFGAGHGGMSFLARSIGLTVSNIDPHHLDASFPFLHHFARYDDAVGKYDFIYGSHSLEHIRDVDAFLGWLGNALAEDGHVFFEVPNCRSNKHVPETMAPPHTHYFTVDFFKKLRFRTVSLATYSYENSILGEREVNLEDGQVIRYLGVKE